MLTAIIYRSHLYYQYLVTYHDFGNVPAVEIQPLEAIEPPADWVKVTEGNLEFWLPPDIASARNADEDGIGAVLYGGDGDRIAAMLNPEERWVSDAPESDDLVWEPTTIRQLAKLYQTNPNDFRWSMTSDEAASHGYRVVLAHTFSPGIMNPAEARFEEEFDGLLTVLSDKPDMAIFQWESKTCPWEGQFMFRDKTGDIDRQWVRIVCASIRFRCETNDNN